MRKLVMASVLAGVGLVAVAQQPEVPSPQVPGSALYNIVPPAPPVYKLDEALLRWPLPQDATQYGTIDGRHIHALVVEQAMISRRYRDQGHPFYWGRPIGSSADAESAEWLAARFRHIGLSDVRVQQLPIPDPVWEPVEPWEVTATNGSKILHLTTAQPPYGAWCGCRVHPHRRPAMFGSNFSSRSFQMTRLSPFDTYCLAATTFMRPRGCSTSTVPRCVLGSQSGWRPNSLRRID